MRENQFFGYWTDYALRSNKHPNTLGILRAGFCRCGICNGSMFVNIPKVIGKHQPQYMCRTKGHNTTISVSILDKFAWECITEVIQNPDWIRAHVTELMPEVKPPVDVDLVGQTIADIDAQMSNLFSLAQHATTAQKTIDSLGMMMQTLEKQKFEAEALLFDASDEEKERLALEAEIEGFEVWAEKARESVDDQDWTPMYEEKRNAVRALGVVATVYPVNGDHPFRYKIDITVPEIMKKITCDYWHCWTY